MPAVPGIELLPGLQRMFEGMQQQLAMIQRLCLGDVEMLARVEQVCMYVYAYTYV